MSKPFSGVEGELYARDHLRKLKVDSDQWLVLYECPDTGQYWVQSYPHSEMHGGGPPRFDRATPEEVARLFPDVTLTPGNR